MPTRSAARLKARFGLLALAWLVATPARADRAVDLERFEPALDAEGFLGVQGTRTPGSEGMNVSLFGGYSRTLLEASPAAGGRELRLVSHRIDGVLGTELGIGSRVAFGTSFPLVIDQAAQAALPGEPPLKRLALADPALHLRYRFAGDTTEAARRDGPGLALQLSSRLPAGDSDAYAGEGAVRTHLQLLGDMHLFGAGLGASIGYRHRFERRSLLDLTLRDEMTFGAALKFPVPPLYPLSVVVEWRGATQFKSKATTALEGELGLRYPIGSQVTLVVAGGLGMTQAIGTPAYRIVGGLWITPGEIDTDHDGVPDKRDACPFLAEDLDGFQDDDGCPDPDNDNDLVPDADDLCPNQAALEDHDADEDGCTDKPK